MFFGAAKFEDGRYCNVCYQKLVRERQERLEREKRKQEEERKKKLAEERNKKANERLRQQLKQERKQPTNKVPPVKKEASIEEKPEQKLKADKGLKPRNSQDMYEDWLKEQIQSFDRFLLIKATVKKLEVIEWIDGKKRVCLDKEREIRKTKAGGFSQGKFQSYVEAKKQAAFDWIVETLERPGVLRDSYDKIEVISEDEALKTQIESFMQDYTAVAF